MILNALDEVLFWEDIPLLKTFMEKIVSQYYPHDPETYFKEKKEYKLAQAAMYWQIQFGIEAYERLLMNPEATRNDYNVIMSCVKTGYKGLKLTNLKLGFKKYIKKRIEYFLFATNPRLVCELKKKELR